MPRTPRPSTPFVPADPKTFVQRTSERPGLESTGTLWAEDVREAEVALAVAHAVGRVGRDGTGRAAAAVDVEFGPKAERHLHERLLLLCASGIRGVRHGGVRTLGCQGVHTPSPRSAVTGAQREPRRWRVGRVANADESF